MRNILAFIDAPDPDNFVMLAALTKLYPRADIHVILTGRPVRFGANKSHALWEWDLASSLMAQQASAARARNFMRHFGVRIPYVYDGGIAPRTLVPHWIHFAEYYKFFDIDPLAALRHSELEPMQELISRVLDWEDGDAAVVIGGPLTGLAQMITRAPEVIAKFKEVHAMLATWGNVQLMDMGGAPRGAKQFNAACDPVATHQILMGLPCPVYIMPTEVTRVAAIGFVNAQALREALPANNGTSALYNLYALWYDAAVKPRQDRNPDEQIFIHDLVGAFSLDRTLREAIYEVIPIDVVEVPYLPRDASRWGEVLMRPATTTDTQRFAATALKPGGADKYLSTLRQIFDR